MKRVINCALTVLLLLQFSALQAYAGKANEPAPDKLFEPGSFFVGVNFWGSESSIYMWRNWNPEGLELDLKMMAENGVQVIRCFPTWPDFQPLTKFYGWGGRLGEYGMKDGFLTDPDGVDTMMINRFRWFADCAQRYNIRLFPSLLTGWMSARLLAPPALQGVNLLTDPEAIMWEVRFVRRFVRELKDHPAIAGWDLGNECNNMDENLKNSYQAWQWLYNITAAIRLEDSSRPVISGMHGLSTVWNATWNLRANGELLDILTPHPYPGFRPEANREPFNCLRNANHPSAQCLMYRGVGGKPAFPEELGCMGPNIASDSIAGITMRMQMIQSWADNLGGYLWWGVFDQGHLNFPPYTWDMMEREVGCATKERKPRATLLAIKEFNEFRRSLPFKTLPARQVDAVVLLPEKDRDAWPMPQSILCLARQAGFDIEFTGAEHELPDARFYILPSPFTWETYTSVMWDRLKKKVHDNGATLLLSRGFEMTGFSEFEEVAGVEVTAQYRGMRYPEFSLADYPGEKMRGVDNAVSLWRATRSEVLAKDQTGNPMVTRADYGKGQVMCVNFAMEQRAVTELAGVFTWKVTNPLYRIYQKAAQLAGVKRKVTRDNPNVTFTEHATADGKTLVVAINCLPETVDVAIKTEGKVGKVWNGSYKDGKLHIAGNDGCVFELK